MDSPSTTYESFYENRETLHIYPVEFVVRAFLGTYPKLKPKAEHWRGRTALDLGFGDGRNMPLLHNLGMTLSGVEITTKIVDLARRRLKQIGVSFEGRVGRNSRIPFADRSFDAVIACHSCYYVDAGETFTDNLQEIARVITPGGRLVCSLPMPDSYILESAKALQDGHFKIVSDPFGIRTGVVFRAFESEREIENVLAPYFDTFSIGSCRNDFWGIDERVWTVVCDRKAVD